MTAGRRRDRIKTLKAGLAAKEGVERGITVSANRKRGKPLVVIVINIVEIPLFLLFSGVWLFMLAWIYKPEWVNFELPVWAKWLAWAFVVCGGLALLFFLDRLKKSYLEKAGYGIKALEPVLEKANKTVIVDTFEVTEVWSSPSGYGGATQVPWTRIRIRHTGKVPCVMEVVKGNTRKIRNKGISTMLMTITTSGFPLFLLADTVIPRYTCSFRCLLF
ncbi:hypothetical protein ES707_18651 [subsurface metagenome]